MMFNSLELITPYPFNNFPSSPIYAMLCLHDTTLPCGEVSLQWQYESQEPTVTKRWRIAKTESSPLKLIMSMDEDGPVQKYNGYKDRIDYIPNAGLRIRNLTLSDDTYIAVSVDFVNGSTAYGNIQLVVTSKYS